MIHASLVLGNFPFSPTVGGIDCIFHVVLIGHEKDPSGVYRAKGGSPVWRGGVGSEMLNVWAQNAKCALRPNNRADKSRTRADRRENFLRIANAIRYCQRAFPTQNRLK